MKKTEILIVGSGAVGSYFGGKLVQEKTRVSALCRSDFEIAKERGLEFKVTKAILFLNLQRWSKMLPNCL